MNKLILFIKISLLLSIPLMIWIVTLIVVLKNYQ